MTKTPKTYPATLKHGFAAVKIYRFKKTKTAKTWTFNVRWKEGTKATNRRFSVEAEAVQFARDTLEYLNSAKRDSDLLWREHKEEYLIAQDLAGEIPVLTAMREWRLATELSGGQLILAAKEWGANREVSSLNSTVNEVAEKFRIAKEREGIKWEKSFKPFLPPFQAAFGNHQIRRIGAERIENWLNKTFPHPTSRNTYQRKIITFFRWGQKRGYLPRGIKTEAELTQRAKEPIPERGIITPGTYRDLLTLVKAERPEFLPALVLAGFCGMRTGEIKAQKWSDIRLEQGRLRVTAAKAGTAVYRFVNISPAAVEWLMLAEEKSGLVCPTRGLENMRYLAKGRGFDLPKNCFRHSFVSYLIALKGVGYAAAQAGHEEKIAHKNYRELVTEEEGGEWFAISPREENQKKVVNFSG